MKISPTILATVALFMAMMLPMSSEAAGDASRGKTHYAICQVCHGENGEGNPLANAPRLAGQYEWYLLEQVRNFRAGLRGADPKDTFGQQMGAMADTLPNEQAVADVVAYIGTLEAPAPPASVTGGGDLVRGEEYYLPCAPCHGSKAQGFKDPARIAMIVPGPRLAGQHDWYLMRQLQNFKARLRGIHDDDKRGRECRVATMSLSSDKTIRNIVSYIQTLK